MGDSQIKRAVILAAGRGSRMNRATDERPKCLVELAGRTLLDWQTASLSEAGIRDITIVRGYRGEDLGGRGYFVVDNPRWNETNMVASLACASEFMGAGETVVSYSDIVYHPSIIKKLVGTKDDIAMVYDTAWMDLWTDRFDNPLDDAETFRAEKGRLLGIGDRTKDINEIEGQFMGLLKFTSNGWKAVEKLLSTLDGSVINKLDMTGLLGLLMESGQAVAAAPVEGRWVEVDSDSDLDLYQQKAGHAGSGRAWRHDWRW